MGLSVLTLLSKVLLRFCTGLGGRGLHGTAGGGVEELDVGGGGSGGVEGGVALKDSRFSGCGRVLLKDLGFNEASNASIFLDEVKEGLEGTAGLGVSGNAGVIGSAASRTVPVASRRRFILSLMEP